MDIMKSIVIILTLIGAILCPYFGAEGSCIKKRQLITDTICVDLCHICSTVICYANEACVECCKNKCIVQIPFTDTMTTPATIAPIQTPPPPPPRDHTTLSKTLESAPYQINMTSTVTNFNHVTVPLTFHTHSKDYITYKTSNGSVTNSTHPLPDVVSVDSDSITKPDPGLIEPPYFYPTYPAYYPPPCWLSGVKCVKKRKSWKRITCYLHVGCLPETNSCNGCPDDFYKNIDTFNFCSGCYV